MNLKKKSAWNNFLKRKNDNYNILSGKKVYDQTKQFCRFLNPFIHKKNTLNILDCACGNGFQTMYIKNYFKYSNFYAFDINHLYINEAKRLYKNINWYVADLSNNFLKKKDNIDLIYSLQTLSILDNGYNKYFNILKKNLPKYFSGSILLCNGNASVTSSIDIKEESFTYNFYNKNKFIHDLENIGYKNIHLKKFNIGIDIKKPKEINYSLGTYTLKNKNKRIMISGPFIMNWYFFFATNEK